MTEPGRPDWIHSVLEAESGRPRHRARDPRGTSWAVLEISGHLFEAVVLLGGGLAIGFTLGGVMLGCGR